MKRKSRAAIQAEIEANATAMARLNLSDEQWDALPVTVRKQLREQTVPQFSVEDWQEVYYALDDKLSSNAVEMTSPKSERDRWTNHLKRMMKDIAACGIKV